MAKRKLSTLIQAITLFNSMDERDKQTLSDYIHAQAGAKPRKVKEKPATAAPAQKETTSAKEAKCGVCGNVKDHPDHDRTYLKSHDFEPPKSSVVRATRKSRQKQEAPGSTPSIEGETGNALAAGAGGD